MAVSARKGLAALAALVAVPGGTAMAQHYCLNHPDERVKMACMYCGRALAGEIERFQPLVALAKQDNIGLRTYLGGIQRQLEEMKARAVARPQPLTADEASLANKPARRPDLGRIASRRPPCHEPVVDKANALNVQAKDVDLERDQLWQDVDRVFATRDELVAALSSET